jgi:hypothetical protein
LDSRNGAEVSLEPEDKPCRYFAGPGAVNGSGDPSGCYRGL